MIKEKFEIRITLLPHVVISEIMCFSNDASQITRHNLNDKPEMNSLIPLISMIVLTHIIEVSSIGAVNFNFNFQFQFLTPIFDFDLISFSHSNLEFKIFHFFQNCHFFPKFPISPPNFHFFPKTNSFPNLQFSFIPNFLFFHVQISNVFYATASRIYT